MATRGAIASGHAETCAAAAEILRDGGNAFDAVVAAGLTATVVEPLLTGLGGGGLMTLRQGESGRVVVPEFFSRFPGLDHGLLPRDFRELYVDYGPNRQVFHTGLGAIAVPAVAPGLEHVARRYGRLPLRRLAQPAARLAREGWRATPVTELVVTLLHSIIAQSPRATELFERSGRPLPRGALFRSEPMARALEAFGEEGAEPFVRGRFARRLIEIAGPPGGSLSLRDLASAQVTEREPLRVTYRDATLYLPPPPSTGGPLLAFGLNLLERLDAPRDSTDAYVQLAAVMRATERARASGFDADLFRPDAVSGLLAPANLARHLAGVRQDIAAARGAPPPVDGPPQGLIPGNTTHISIVDEEGNAASYTSSNGETCGTLWPGTDLPLNNFLGEDDIHPLGFHRGDPGGSLRTMMTPALLETSDGALMVLGTGGSNRIRTAMLQVVRHVVDEREGLHRAVMHPRIHLENDTMQIEDLTLTDGTVQALSGFCSSVSLFETRHLYFGGVHTVRRGADGHFEARGDPRRSGDGCVVD